MLTLDVANSTLIIVDFQSRLMPAIHQGETAVKNAGRLLDAAQLLGVPAIFTEQNAKGLGATVPELDTGRGRLFHKQYFDAAREAGFLDLVPQDRTVVVAGCEAHVCVQQTVLGMIDHGRSVSVVRDALGARQSESKETAILRMASKGADIVTTEMVVFEWLQTAEHPRFREAVALIK